MRKQRQDQTIGGLLDAAIAHPARLRELQGRETADRGKREGLGDETLGHVTPRRRSECDDHR